MSVPNFDDYEARADAVERQVRERVRQRVIALAGSHGPIMLQTLKTAREFVRSEDPNLRQAAIFALAAYWKITPTTEEADEILRIASDEADPNVRREALSAIGPIYHETDDVEVGALLAQIVKNEGVDLESRKSAYIGLHFLRHKVPEALGRFPACIDWSFVNRFLDSSRVPDPVDSMSALVKSFPARVEQKHVDIARVAKLVATGLHAEAVNSANNLLKAHLEPGFRAIVFTLRAESHLGIAQPQNAIIDASAAIEIDRRRTKAYLIRSQAYEQLGDTRRAMEDAILAKELE
jgi:HEAT repeat protein